MITTKNKAVAPEKVTAFKKTLLGNNTTAWLEELNTLLWRFSAFGIGPDIAAMTFTELWGVYCFLHRMAGGAS